MKEGHNETVKGSSKGGACVCVSRTYAKRKKQRKNLRLFPACAKPIPLTKETWVEGGRNARAGREPLVAAVGPTATIQSSDTL